MENLCPCGSGKLFSRCCAKFIKDRQLPETAEQLMRSRYTAYALKDTDYILKTWHISGRPKKFNLDLNIQWLGLQVIDTVSGSKNDNKGTVLFEAHYRFQNNIYFIRETAEFVKENNVWLYLYGNQSKMTIA